MEALPIDPVLPRVGAVLAAGRNLLLVAPPGAGKTTRVPPALLAAPWRGDGVILLLEPRRLAARAAAERIATLLGEPVGGTVGYRTRIDQASGPRTRILAVTTGLAVRRLLDDPGLEGVAAVLLDEVHERSLEADLALALLLDAQAQLRPDLRLAAMSATADADRLAELMQAERVQSEGRAFDVEVRHAARDLPHVRDLPAAMAAAIRAALAQHGGDLLCFLPGMAEIRRTEQALGGIPARLHVLHGDLPPGEQQAALAPAEERKLVLATSIAETSLTVPGVRVVIDGGFRRAPRLDRATGLTRLTTLRVSRAAAAQRAGRAGREAPGVAIRLWTEATQRGLPEHERPEILEAELSGLVLDCAAWGTGTAQLRFADPPPAGPLAAGTALLETLGAMQAGRLTEAGRRIAGLGAHPRLGAMMHAAADAGERALAADLAACLEERDFLRDPRPRGLPTADMAARLAVLQGGPGETDRAALARVRQAARHYRRRLGLAESAAAAGDAARLLAAAFPDRVAQAAGERGRYRLSGGGMAGLPADDALARARLLVVAALEVGTSARIGRAAVLDPADLPPALAAQVQVSVETTLDPVSGAVLARRRTRLGALILQDRTEAAAPDERAALLAAQAARDIGALDWTDEARQLQARVALMRQLEPRAWPDLSDAALSAGAADWLAAALADATRLSAVDVAAALAASLNWEQKQRLERELPARLALPHGQARVDYLLPVPQAEARAQCFYGLQQMPLLAAGRIKLRLALLSPAGRPIAVTGDIAQFWQTGWPDARRDMRGRYPRHDWPDF